MWLVACVCGGALGTQPADGSVDVPLNAQLIITNGRAITLLDDEDNEVELGPVEDLASLDRYTPVAPLEAGRQYRIQASTDLLTTFMTGNAADADAPASTGLTAASAWTAPFDCSNDCAHGDVFVAVDLSVTVPEDVAYYQIVYTHDGEIVQADGLLPEDLPHLRNLDTARCGIAPPPMMGPGWCIELTARDLAGNGTTATSCFTPETRGSIDCAGETSSGCNATNGAPAWPLSGALLVVLLWLLSTARPAACRRR